MPSNSPSKNVRKLKKEVSKSSVASDPLEELASLPPSPKKPRIDHQPVSSGLSSAARSAMSRIPRDPQNVSLPMTPELKGLLDKVKEARKGGGTANHDVQKALDHVIRYRELAKGGSEIEVLKTQMEQAEYARRNKTYFNMAFRLFKLEYGSSPVAAVSNYFARSVFSNVKPSSQTFIWFDALPWLREQADKLPTSLTMDDCEALINQLSRLVNNRQLAQVRPALPFSKTLDNVDPNLLCAVILDDGLNNWGTSLDDVILDVEGKLDVENGTVKDIQVINIRTPTFRVSFSKPKNSMRGWMRIDNSTSTVITSRRMLEELWKLTDSGRRSIHHHGTNFDVHAVAALARDCNALQEERKINKSVYKLVTDIGTFVFTTLLYAMRAAMTDQQWPSLAQAFIYHNLHAILPLPAVLDDNDVLMPDPIDDYIDGGRDGLSASVAKIYSDPSAAYLITKIAKCDDDTRQQQSVDNVFAQKCLSALQSRRGNVAPADLNDVTYAVPPQPSTIDPSMLRTDEDLLRQATPIINSSWLALLKLMEERNVPRTWAQIDAIKNESRFAEKRQWSAPGKQKK